MNPIIRTRTRHFRRAYHPTRDSKSDTLFSMMENHNEVITPYIETNALCSKPHRHTRLVAGKQSTRNSIVASISGR
jgi:hypothetical protein